MTTRIKITASGKISLKLHFFERSTVYSAVIDFLEEEESVIRSVRLNNESSVMRMLVYMTINELVEKDFSLQSTDQKKLSMTRSQAVALMWILRNYDNQVTLLELKSQLHKILS